MVTVLPVLSAGLLERGSGNQRWISIVRDALGPC